MKKYLIGSFAVVIAIVALAFTSPKTVADTYVFEYTGNFTENSVEDLENWQFIGRNLAGCDNQQDQACRIFMSRSDIDSTSPTQLKLNSSVSITEEGAEPNIHVTSVTGTGTASYSNKSN